MKFKILLFLSFASLSRANIGLSPSVPLFPEEGIVLPKESVATLKLGYYVDWTIKENQKNKHDISHAKLASVSQFGTLALSLFDLVDLYGFVGAESNTLKFRKLKSNYKFQDNSSYSWALMADGILNTWGKLQLGVTAFYSSNPPHKGKLYKDNNFIQKTYYYYHAWGVGLGFAYDFLYVAPYARIDYKQSKSSLEYFRKQFFHTMHTLGLAFGAIADFTHGFYADVEVSIIQSYSVRGMLGLRF